VRAVVARGGIAPVRALPSATSVCRVGISENRPTQSSIETVGFAKSTKELLFPYFGKTALTWGMNAPDYANELRKLQETIKSQADRIKELEAEIANLKTLLSGKAETKAAKKPRFTENYSLDKNRRRKQRRKKSTGRRSSDAKCSLINEEAVVYPAHAVRKRCILHRTQCAWRIVEGKARYIRYSIYDLPDSQDLPLPPGLRNNRSEFGIEIILILAYLHYWIGVSLDKACEVMKFFTGLVLSKSQADSLLSQLASDWNEQYDTIAELIALQMIVYIDETGWKVGKHSCYTWAFSTAMHVLFRCGVGRGKAEAEAVLGEAFAGIGVTDDYAAYKCLFTEHQLCWAHLIRKAIKLALQNPEQKEYASFLNELCAIYQQGVAYQKDKRLTVGRGEKVLELQERIRSLCSLHGTPIDKDLTPEHTATFIHLQNELADHLECLFVFVQHPAVEATNNRSEHNVRPEAEVRKGGRTSKTANGAKRRGIIMTVLASLRTRFTKFTLDTLLAEVKHWAEMGRSIFESELEAFQRETGPPALEPAPCI
jgi:transposase